MDEQVAELTQVLQRYKLQSEEGFKQLSSAAASLRHYWQEQVAEILRPSLEAWQSQLQQTVAQALNPWASTALALQQGLRLATPANVIEASFRSLREALAPSRQLQLLQHSLAQALRSPALRLVEEQRKAVFAFALRIYVPNFGQVLQHAFSSIAEPLRHLWELPRLIPYWVCELTLYAFEEDNQGEILDFFSRYLGITAPKTEDYLILWEVLRGKNWLQAHNPIAYVAKVFWRKRKKAQVEETATREWRNLLTPRDKYGLHPRVSVAALYDEEGFPLNIPIFERGYSSIEEQALLEWALSHLTPEEQEAVRLWGGVQNWYEVGRILCGDPNQGRVIGQRIMRKFKRLRASLLN